MKELQAIVRALVAPGAPGAPESVLATLVTVEGSSYRRPGARLLVTADGTRIGSISGGCLEEDVLARARRVLATGKAEAVVYDTTSENDLVWGVGLGCHGVVRVLLEKLPAHPDWAAVMAENFTARRSTKLAVVHHAEDHPHSGTHLATDLPRPLLEDASQVFLENIPPPTALAIFGAGDDAQPLVRLAEELGWHVTVADPRAAFATSERFPSADRVVVAPADELAARVYDPFVVPAPVGSSDIRAVGLPPEKEPESTKRWTATSGRRLAASVGQTRPDAPEGAQGLVRLWRIAFHLQKVTELSQPISLGEGGGCDEGSDPSSAEAVAIVMTHHYVHDVPLLRTLLPRPLAYLGLLGPKKRAEKILADLARAGFDPTAEQRARLHAPVGLDLGADGPEQVALAIVAEIQAVLAGRNAHPLRERSRPIHE